VNNFGENMMQDETERPWGGYEILRENDSYKVKTIYVNPGKRLSYQRHEKRAEHWFVISGQARITLNGNVFEMSAGDSIDIGIGDLHRIENIGSDEVIFVEVQTGTYFGEDDIERVEDDFGR
jgi:mannose-6-phosphate isomerase